MTILENKEMQVLLSRLLENKSTFYKESAVSTKYQKYGYNQYSFFIVVDFLIKYQMIITDDSLFPMLQASLASLVVNYTSHQELVTSLQSLLGDLVKQQLQLENKISPANKREILSYIYDRYIVHGYFFYSFSSRQKDEVMKNGIDPKDMQEPAADMKKIAYIFSNHKYDHFVEKEMLQSKNYISLTDSPALAYFYALNVPTYLANLSALSECYNQAKYDQEAYYRKDFEACYHNLKTLCHHIHSSDKEEEKVLSTFERQWNMADAPTLVPCIAYINRASLHKDYLPEINEILDRVDEEDLTISIARIIDSRYPVLRRYQSLDQNEFRVELFPTYNTIKQSLSEELKTVEVESLFPPGKKIIPTKKRRYQLSYGYATALVLLILFVISLAVVLFLILRYMGG